MDLAILLIFVLLRQEVGALKLLEISVPRYPRRGENVELKCRYDMETSNLYSVTWYKDSEVFYRYVPKGSPSQHTYPVDGVNVDRDMSDGEQVRLQHIRFQASGLYICEVSAEAPSFSSVRGEARMEVMALPEERPTITGEEDVYANGDILALNCTSAKSYPAATLRWFINGVQVRPDAEAETLHHHGLISTISTLRLEIGPHHLADGKINVRCEAIVQSSQLVSEPLVDLKDTQVFVQGHASFPTPCLPLFASLALHRLLLMA